MLNKPKTRAEAERHTYGTNMSKRAYDPARCAEEVWSNERWPTSYQCNRKPGHGPDGLYCKQHDPAAEAKRARDRETRWKAERDKERPKWYAQDMLDLIRKIAEGHNDPRSLCQDFLKEYDKSRG